MGILQSLTNIFIRSSTMDNGTTPAVMSNSISFSISADVRGHESSYPIVGGEEDVQSIQAESCILMDRKLSTSSAVLKITDKGVLPGNLEGNEASHSCSSSYSDRSVTTTNLKVSRKHNGHKWKCWPADTNPEERDHNDHSLPSIDPRCIDNDDELFSLATPENLRTLPFSHDSSGAVSITAGVRRLFPMDVQERYGEIYTYSSTLRPP